MIISFKIMKRFHCNLFCKVYHYDELKFWGGIVMTFLTVMQFIVNIIVVGFLLTVIVIGLIWLIKDKRQSQHSVLRNYPLLARIRYISEKIGPELRQYLFSGDNEGSLFHVTIIKISF